MKTKEKVILILSILAPFAVIFIYVWMTAADVVFRDDIYLIKGGFVEKYCAGTLSLADLWRASDINRLFGYSLLQLLSIKWSGMNSRIIVLMIPCMMLVTAMLVYHEYRRSLLPEKSPEFVAATFVLLSLIIFNLVQWEGLTFAYSFVFQAPMPLFVVSFISMELFITKGNKKYWPAAFLLPCLAVLFFGGSHSFSFLASLAVVFTCYVALNRGSLTKILWFRAGITGIFLAVIIFFYMYRIEVNNYWPVSSMSMDKLWAAPVDVLKFFMAALGASVVGVNAANMYLSFRFMVFLGFCIFLVYCLCIYFYLAAALYKKTYLPLFLMLLAILYLMFMTTGRFAYGLDYGMSSRYTCVSIYGLVGCIWTIILLAVYSGNLTLWQRSLFYAPVVIIISGVMLTSAVEWKIQPHRQTYFQNLYEIALRVDTATGDELSKFEERPELVRQSLKVLRDCNLSIYRYSSANENVK
jgi:hypothetical protein